jgi:hypothetical protein
VAESYQENIWTLWIKSLGMFLIGVGTVFTSWTAVNVQKTIAKTQIETSRREIAFKQDSVRLQERAEAGRIAASIIPLIKCRDDLQQALGLRLLTDVAPDHARAFAEVISERCQHLSTEGRTQISEVQQRSVVRQSVIDFLRRLSNAREYRNLGHDGPAARLFSEASTSIPVSLVSKVNRNELAKAKAAFEEGSFKMASDLFALAFSGIPDSE